MKVAVFGLGYVGTVTAAGLAAEGHRVVGVDVDEHKVRSIRAGSSPVVEPGLEEMVAGAALSGALTATTDPLAAMEGADVSLVCVGTPSGPHGETDLVYIRRAVADIRQAMETASPPPFGHHSVVVRSTVPPGTGAEVVAPLFVDPPGGWAVGTAMCPEFLREGSGVADFYDPPFVVVGTSDDRTVEAVGELFAFLGGEVVRSDVPTAEALKYACNAFHATKISFTNEIARVFRDFGVDSREVMRIFCQDEKLNVAPAYLRPGFAFGGSCLPKDLRAVQHMARMAGVDVPLLAGARQTNDLVMRDVVDRVLASGLRRVAVLGLSFKADTDDLRESPNVELAERLIGKGLDVRIYDPIVNPERLVGANRREVEARLPHLNRLLTCSPEEALADAEVVLVSSADPGVVAALGAAQPRLVIDLDGRLGQDVERLAGYQGVGW